MTHKRGTKVEKDVQNGSQLLLFALNGSTEMKLSCMSVCVCV